MNGQISIVYYDRMRDRLMKERIYAGPFLYWSYNTTLGRLMMDLIFRQRVFSQIYGWFHRQKLSRHKIKVFLEKMNMNHEDLIRKIEDFKSFNEFFTREIDLSKRPINADPRVCIAPVDGKILTYPKLNPDMTFQIKRNTFNLHKFLCDDKLTDKFSGGSMLISRLCLTDYHHFHFPDSGIPGQARPIQGKYHAGGPYGLRTGVPFYAENYRMLTIFDSDHFGQIGMVEIGALTVGSIQQRYQAGIHVAKGSRKGLFELGGSTVVLIFQKGRIELDEDLLINTKREMETYVRFGDSIGRVPKRSEIGGP